ncbi:MAG: hypothetical protein HYY06_26185 [Deltaproteobacteria bacterium]|nr:hypothetical protein [Deltaproteobacteria bacterium]
MEGLLRYLAEKGRSRARPRLPPPRTEATQAVQIHPAQPRLVREQYLSALASDGLVLCDVSATAGAELVLEARLRTADLERVVRTYVSAGVGPAASFEVVSPGSLAATLGLGESPLGRLERLATVVPGLLLEATLDATTGLGTRPVSEAVLRETALEVGRAGAGLIRVREAANRLERLQAALAAAARTDALVETVCVLSGDVPGARVDGVVESMRKLASQGAAILGIEDPRGALRPLCAYGLVRALRRELPALPVRLRLVDSVGVAVASAVAAAEAGVGAVAVVQLPLGRPHGPPTASALTYALGSTERAPAIGEQALSAITREWRETIGALELWHVAQREHDGAPAEIPTRESVPPRATGDLETIVRQRSDRATDAVREAILEAHDPAAFQRRRRSLERYGQLTHLPTNLFVDGLAPGEDALVPATNGGAERHVVFRSLEGLSASFEVDGVSLDVSLSD